MASRDMTDNIRARISAYCTLTNKTRKEIADGLDMSYSTFLSKLNGPSEFSFKEGLRLAELIGVTPDELVMPIGNI